MRPIKFRAWNKESKKMTKPFGLSDGCQLDIVMQFAGLQDRNGKEIYEGDIVTYNGFVVKGIVRYDRYKRHQFMNGDQPHENIGFYIKGIPEESKSGISNTFEYPLIQNNNVIIIGNIHENPELLKGEIDNE